MASPGSVSAGATRLGNVAAVGAAVVMGCAVDNAIRILAERYSTHE
ncbi:hypothetical protein [Glutamicibacter ardleyensis]